MAVSICNVHTDKDNKELNSYDNLSFPIACYEDNLQQISVPVHWHDEYEFIVATQGTVTVLVNTTQITLLEGEAIFINAGCLHGVLSVKNTKSVLRSLVILPKYIGGSSEHIIFRKIIVPLSLPSAPAFLLLNEHSPWQDHVISHMLKAWNLILTESYDFENDSRYYISKALRLLVDHLSERTYFHKENTAMLSRMKTCLSYIEDHYGSDITNQDLMQLCNCSESVLLRSFKQIVGISPQQYLINFRIQKATDLLLSTELKSCDIATACGFHDFSYFTKIFKRTIGMTPIEYRNAYF